MEENSSEMMFENFTIQQNASSTLVTLYKALKCRARALLYCCEKFYPRIMKT